MDSLLKTPDLGTGAPEERDRVDFTRLRQVRRGRVFEMMERLELDACVFGREANVRYLTGARRLWTALSRPFAPTCVAVRDGGQVHLMSFSASYEGMPEELQPDDVYALSWNPMHFVAHITGMLGTTHPGRVGVDGLTPLFEGLLRMAFPGADLVGVQPDLRAVRRVKMPEELTCIRIAAATAEAALVAAIDGIQPGVRGKELQGAYLARMSTLGAPQFAQLGTFAAISDSGELRFDTTSEPIPGGVPVALSGGALWAGYEGSLARTWWCGEPGPSDRHRLLYRAWSDTTSAVLETCRPGSTGADVLGALTTPSTDTGSSAVYSVGLGHEGPVAATWLDGRALQREVLEPGMVLAARILTRSDHGVFLGEDMFLVTEDGPEPITTLGPGPIAL